MRTEGGKEAEKAERGHPQVSNGVGDQHAAPLQRGLEGDSLAHGRPHGTPAGLHERPPEYVVGHVGKPKRLDVVELAHVVEHHVLRQEVHRQAHCAAHTTRVSPGYRKKKHPSTEVFR